jgi:hypothetical protein
MHVMEPGQRIPRKKKLCKRTIQIGSNGKQVDIEDSDSDDDHKMPSQISRKKPKKVADPMDTDSSAETDEDEDCKAVKEEIVERYSPRISRNLLPIILSNV